mmetsp:Transcript_36060/g.102088  ORF Transcript_36060/g.102088 Transcript_36060/m.102088 type:complete len:159 (-) Transcript_36060:305-781(-)
MGCYFGCGTAASRCAWFWYIVLVVGSALAFTFWTVRNSDCVGQATVCAEKFNLTEAGPAETDLRAPSSGGQDAILVFCQDLFGQATLPPGGMDGLNGTGVQGRSMVADCVTCVGELSRCMTPTMPLFYAGLILALLTLLPCFFCCCCAMRPDGSTKYV